MSFVFSLIMGFSSLTFANNGASPIQMPSVHDTERTAFGWNPSYTVNLPAFNSTNYAFFRGRSENANDIPPFSLEFFSGNELRRRSYRVALLENFPSGTTIESTIGASGRRYTSGVFNSANEYFTLVGLVLSLPNERKLEKAWVLLWTGDAGLNWGSYVIARQSEFANRRCPTRYNFGGICSFPTDVEMARNFSPAAIQGNMPSLLLYYNTGRMRVRQTDRFDQIGRLSLLLISRGGTGENVSSHEYIPLSSRALGIGSHSGGSTKVIRYDGKVYVAWLSGTTRPETGSPTFVAMYDAVSKRLVRKIVAYTRPSNDSHNQPGITMTSGGILHVIAGAHGDRMQHTYNLQKASIRDWSAPRYMRLTDEQTYISLIIDSNDKIHAVYRRWNALQNSQGEDIIRGTLTYQQFNGENWSPPTVLVNPTVSGYFIYYQHLTIDKNDNLYLSYSRWSSQSPYYLRNNIPQFRQTALLRSGDGGATWRLATDQDISSR